ncbi:MAG: hypothetical protein JJU26_05435 [Oceanicaulis sp.]|uniref:hypothetical protein n=1 Tax=Glycocaulis sp. TaxID=1969725 RepID=UPI0025BB9E5B|nr:hypothetical protein [Glycocaulis sp.]MCC5981145.1 hypothetical protein [Oceanicaulis sp.]MCH8520550.1 hypothetical protein [Glycocaulis sp.]
MKTFLLIAVLGVMLVSAVLVSGRVWLGIDTQMGAHGWVALALGAGLTFLVAVGLMGLVFHSARRGYDDVDGED